MPPHPGNFRADSVGATTKGTTMLERIKEMTGIYSLGFDKASFVGIALPLLFVIVVGGGLSALVLMM